MFLVFPFVKKHDGNLQVPTVHGENLQVFATNDAPHSLPLHHEFLTPCLSTNLSAGQLVDNSCTVSLFFPF